MASPAGASLLPFPAKPVPRVAMGDPQAFEYIKREEPVVLTDVSLVKPLVGKWTVDYLDKHFPESMPFTVFSSDSQFFQYWDAGKNEAGYEFTPPTRKLSMTFRQFAETLRSRAQDGEASAQRHYLQQMLVTGMGEQILQDFKEVDWQTIYKWKDELRFGDLTTNLLLVGEPGHCTPCHYDEQHNFFSQLHGRKQVILFAPSDWDKLYPFPVHHACDRQSQVDLFRTGKWPKLEGGTAALPGEQLYPPNGGADTEKFPNFGRASAFEAVVNAGEMLYIPSYWWHHISSLEETVSLTFWFKCSPVKTVTFPLSGVQRVALRRNIEAQMAVLVGGGRGVRDLLQAMLARNMSSEQDAALLQIRALLQHVLPEHEIEEFLHELARHRFALPLRPHERPAASA